MEKKKRNKINCERPRDGSQVKELARNLDNMSHMVEGENERLPEKLPFDFYTHPGYVDHTLG